ncbi:MAG: NAD(P)H-quinone oxidoreductase [Gammaproteobacteria bacterium]|nr:NAD(P)H-quinone oxidoreductase [Gammaproteobacteria bacterium]
MNYINTTEFGGPEVLALEEQESPTTASGQVLIKVKAAGINRPDVFQRAGFYPPPPGASDIPGLEIAGEVVEIAEDVSWPQPGDQVCALVSGGGYAELCVADARLCLPIPEGFSHIQAAAIPETFFTVWSNVFDRGQLKAGEKILIHGGSSGIGTTAIQLAKAFGATVFVTAGSPEKCRACIGLGADLAINYKEEDFVAECKKATDDYGVDLILDMVAGDYISRNIGLAAPDGRIVIIAGLQGFKVEADFQAVMRNRLTITGSTLRARSVEFKAKIGDELKKHVWPLFISGEVKPVIHKVFPLTDAAEAHRMMESSSHIGKIILKL